MRNSKKNKFLDSKKNAESAHFKKRMIQRYNIFFNRFEKRQMIEDIETESNGAKFIYNQNFSKSVWSVMIQDKRVPVVYIRRRRSLVTALTWKMVEENVSKLT